MTESEVTDLPEPDSPTMPKDLVLVDVETHAVDGLGRLAFDVEVGAEIFDLEELLALLGAAVPRVRFCAVFVHLSVSSEGG
jgi:hypothetical protein